MSSKDEQKPSTRASRRHESVQMKNSIVRMRHQSLMRSTKETMAEDFLKLTFESKGRQLEFHEKVLEIY